MTEGRSVEKIDIVLPICNSARTGLGDFERARRGLFPSLRRFGYHDYTDTVHLISPSRDLEAARDLASLFPEFRFSIAADEDVLLSTGIDPDVLESVPGWFRQQMIKLSITSRSPREVVLILDADVVASKTMSAKTLRSDAIPYQKGGLGHSRGWYEASARALGVDFSVLEPDISTFAMGVTPEFLSTEIVAGLIAEMERRSEGRSWGAYLMDFRKGKKRHPTEFSLYWVWYASRTHSTIRHKPARLYKWVKEPAHETVDIINSDERWLFLVLQSQQCSISDCEIVYEEFKND